MTATTALLKFSAALNDLGDDKKLSDGLSAVVMTGDTLWVAHDETTFVERLSRERASDGQPMCFAAHARFDVGELLDLPIREGSTDKADREIDIEGLDYRDGYLWLTGSHSLKRGKPAGKSDQEDRRRLAKVSGNGNRFFLATIPVQEGADGPVLKKEVKTGGESRRAASLGGGKSKNDLTELLAKDTHVGPFMQIPGKDNGFDIEGLAAGANNHVFLGLRGPVLRGWAVILEIKLAASSDNDHRLELDDIGSSENPKYRKHFIDLDGLGVRDLCTQGEDLLILAGPSMDLDGPVKVFCWKGGASPGGERVVHDTQRECLIPNVPYGDGCDHAEGMALIADSVETGTRVMIVYDSAGDERKKQEGGNATLADILECHAPC